MVLERSAQSAAVLSGDASLTIDRYEQRLYSDNTVVVCNCTNVFDVSMPLFSFEIVHAQSSQGVRSRDTVGRLESGVQYEPRLLCLGFYVRLISHR